MYYLLIIKWYTKYLSETNQLPTHRRSRAHNAQDKNIYVLYVVICVEKYFRRTTNSTHTQIFIDVDAP